jgi:hypothetical protein
VCFLVFCIFKKCYQTFSICNVGDYGHQTYQTEGILKRATSLEFTAI